MTEERDSLLSKMWLLLVRRWRKQVDQADAERSGLMAVDANTDQRWTDEADGTRLDRREALQEALQSWVEEVHESSPLSDLPAPKVHVTVPARVVQAEESDCCGARVWSSLADGVLAGACSKCGRWVVRANPRTGEVEMLHGRSPWAEPD